MHEVSHFGRRFALITPKVVVKGVKRREEKNPFKIGMEVKTLSFP